MNKELIPTEGKLATFIEQLQPNVVIRPLTNSNGAHKGLALRSFTVLELTKTGYTFRYEKDSAILFSLYPSEEEVLCISNRFVTTRLNSVITVWEFIYPTSGE